MMPFRSNSRRSTRSRRSIDRAGDTSNPFERQSQRDPYIMTFPVHPLPSMQAPFEESMLDATGETGYVPFQQPNKNIDARQQQLCRDVDADPLDWNFTYKCHWRTTRKGNFHPLLKTLAQIVFGVHLLHQHLEKSVADVADILLKHVNELDSFLQRANEDIEGSLKDMLFRRKCLKVPMEHVNEFDRLLDDRMYRAQLLEGNVTIERTIERMSQLLEDYLIDISTFRDANQDLDVYLSTIGDAWADANDDVGRIYSAMCGNTSGWSQFLQSLLAKAEKLGVVLMQVHSYCIEIEKRCGAASRRSLIASRSSSRSTNSRDAARSFRNFADNKPLPMVPDERPPFMTLPGGSASEDVVLQRHAIVRPNAGNNSSQPRTFDSEDSLQQQSTGLTHSTATSTQTSNSDVTVLPRSRDRDMQAEYHEVPSSGHDQHGAYAPEDPDHPAAHTRQRHQQGLPQQETHTKDRNLPKRILSKGRKGDSPPLTGKDSAYSSVSGGSFASPAAALPRSASAQSAYPRAQFGLFPSSNPGTPKHSVSGRHGALSPALPSPRPPGQQVPQTVQRSQSSFDNYSSSSRRLLKKSSLSSLKRLFSKKKHGGVDTIAE